VGAIINNEFEKLKLDYPAVSEEQKLALHQAGQQLLNEYAGCFMHSKFRGCPC